jgi:trimethylamine--corrinoid protein Co-methyltransferase
MARDSSRRRARRAAEGLRQLPWREVVNPYAPIEVLSADQVEAIHAASLRVLQETGMRVLDAGARERLARAGADVDHSSMLVRFDRGLIEESVARAPAEFRLRARNPARSVTVGGNRIVFCAVGGPAYCNDLDRGRRTGTYAEMCDFIRLVQSLNVIHQEGGGPFEPMDLPPETRHLDIAYAGLTLTDKTSLAWTLGRARAADAIEMACIALGETRDALAREPAVIGIVNTNSPLQLDVPMAEGLIELAEARQPLVITPFTLAGAMAPVTLAGALAQQNAEALAGIALVQIVSPGAPVMYGGFTSNVDMKSGAPAFGTPEYAKAALASAQLARRYGIPFRSSNVTASNAVDAQAAYESSMSLWATVMAHTNIVKHCAGWLEGGLTASFEKLIVDAEMLQMMTEFLRPIEVDDETLGLDAIAEVGPGGHFFGAAHTLERYETAFYAPMLSDWRNFETWAEAGGLTATQRANAVWKQLLAEYEPPPLDPGIDEALQAYVARRKAEGGARTY